MRYLLEEPDLSRCIFAVQNWHRPDEGKQPDQVAQLSGCNQVFVDKLHEGMRMPAVEHVEVLAKGHVPHDVEAVKVEPFRCVKGDALVFLDSLKQQIGVLGHAGLIIAKGFIDA